MEQDTTLDAVPPPGRGSPEAAAWMRGMMDDLGLGPSALARLMLELGDDRPLPNVVRSLQRMLAGEARVSGEMRALLTYLHNTKPQMRAMLTGQPAL